MADSTRQKLGEAFELIKKERVDEAIAMLRPITEAEPENADAWWLMANAAGEARNARRALVNVLKINPTYPKARELLDQLNELHPPRDDELMLLLEIEDVAPPPSSATSREADEDDGQTLAFGDEDDDAFPKFNAEVSPEIDNLFSEVDEDLDIPDDPFGDTEIDDFGLDLPDDPFADLLDEGDAPKRRRSASGGGRERLLRIVAILLIVFLCLAVVLVVLGGGDDEPDAAETDSLAPSEQIVEAGAVNAENAENLETVRQAIEIDAQSLSQNSASANFVQVGEVFSLRISTCSRPSNEISMIVLNGMDMLVTRIANTPAIQDDLDRIGVVVSDCQQPTDTLFSASAAMTDVLNLPPNISPSDPSFVAFRQTWVENR